MHILEGEPQARQCEAREGKLEKGEGRRHRKQKPLATLANNAKKSESVYALTDKEKKRESVRGGKRE